ncbi:MAG: RagB/SusD family nutrient uptake outer membrane protein, partial [Prevotella sp.]
MKKTYHIIMTIIGIVWMALSTTLLSSCLDENPKDRLLEYKAYDTATNLYINSVGNLYNYIGGNSNSQGIQGTYRGVYDYNTFTTDEAILPTRGGDWYDGGFWQNLYRHQWTATDKALLDTWNYLYKVVGLCNHSLAEIEYNKNLLTDAEYNEYTAEVKGMRALFYFYIMDMFGNVPLSMKDGAKIG